MKIKLLAILPCVALEVVIASAISAAAQQETILLNLNYNGQVGGRLPRYPDRQCGGQYLRHIRHWRTTQRRHRLREYAVV